MWLLISSHVKDDQIYILQGTEYRVGRKPGDCEVPILNDQSVSRKHAVLSVSHPAANLPHPHKPAILSIKDLSKFGTFVNDSRLSKDHGHILKDGDVIKFGSLQSVYKVHYQPLILTTSCLDGTLKKTVKSVCCRLGAHVLTDWRKDCTLLVMSQLSVTIKVICALITKRPIVTPEYLTQLQAAIEARTTQPNPEDYLPPLSESQLDPQTVSFKDNDNRSKLLQGKILIFLSPKQFKKLSLATELAGGVPVLMEEGSDNNDDNVLIQSNTCVMYTDPDDPTLASSQNASEWIRHVMDVLRKHKKRAIQESELGYAVLYCSTVQYCNPDTESGVNINQSGGSLSSQTLPLLAGISQTQLHSNNNRTVLAGDTESQFTQDSTPPSSAKSQGPSSMPMSGLGNSKQSQAPPFLQHVIKEEPSFELNKQVVSTNKRQFGGDCPNPPSKRRALIGQSQDVKEELEKSLPATVGMDNSFKVTNKQRPSVNKHHSLDEIPVRAAYVKNGSDAGGVDSDAGLVKTERNGKLVEVYESSYGGAASHSVPGMASQEHSRRDTEMSGGPVTTADNGSHDYLNTRCKLVAPEDEGGEVCEAQVVTELVSLIRKGSSERCKPKSAQNGATLWNGKPVKNFKKFKKVVNIGSNNFPAIIGGADLVCHSGSNGAGDDVDFGMSQNPSQSSKQSRNEEDFE